MDIWVGIEVTRQVRVVDGKLQAAGELAVGGVNLLEHQIGVAKQIAPPDNICVLSPQGDEKLLEIVGRHGVREIAPYDFVAMLAERAKRGEEGAVVLLRQIAPLRNAEGVNAALGLLKKHPVVISACERAGHEDLRCLAFEVRRVSQFSMQAMAELGVEEELAYITAKDFAELVRPQDEAEVAARLLGWK
jgi:hypothetical protein